MDENESTELESAAMEPVAESAVWSDDEPEMWGDDSQGDEDTELSVPAAPDPLVTPLLVFALGLVVVILVATGGIFLYLRALNRAPRTTVEHDLVTYASAVKETPRDANAWIMYALAQSNKGEYEDALATLKRAEKATGLKIFGSTRGDVLRFAKRYKKAIEAYDAALVEIDEQKRQVESQRVKVGVNMETEDIGYEEAYFGRGLCRMALDDPQGAIKDYLKSIESDPNNSTVQSALGDAYYSAGDLKKAAAAYRQALMFVPDMKSALDGLDKIEKGQSK